MVKIYTTKRMGNNGREYVGVNINNRQFEIPGRQITGTKTKYFKLKEVPKKNIEKGLIAVFDKPTILHTQFAYTDIIKGQIEYSLPESKKRKVIAVYQQIKRFK